MIITGASSGIGAATALACAGEGMHLLLNGRNAERLGEVAQQCRDAGVRVETVAADVTEPGLSGHLLDVADETLDGFYAVFANAGYGYKRAAHEIALDEVREMFEINFFAAYALVQEAARRLLARAAPGHLLMCSSAVAKFTMQNFSAYSATKAAQNHVCRAMRMELRQHNIQVSSVHPITTRTEFFVRAEQAVGLPGDAEHAFDHVPRWMLQSPRRVARAIIRCLHRPRAEVWTSWPTRIVAGLMPVFPGLMDVIGRQGDPRRG